MIKDRFGIIIVVGNRENGKSTFMVRHIKRELAMKRVYRQAYTNLTFIDSPEVIHTNYAGIRQLDAANASGVPDMIVGIDQLHLYCDARRSGSMENVEFCQTLIESRQHGFDIIGTTWALSSIDPRMRKFVDLVVLAERTPRGFRYTYQEPDQVRPMMQITLPFAEAARGVWPYYRTTELVKDDTLTKIASAKKDERADLAKELAIYQPCGGKKIAA